MKYTVRRILRLFFLVALVALLIIQFIPVDRSVAKVEELSDIFFEYQASEKIQGLVKAACYDCHSFQTEYPWYSRIAPVSFYMQGHIDHGRGKLNFSDWASYDSEKKSHKLEECAEFVRETKMPLLSYIIAHADARISEEERELLAKWFEQNM